MKFFLVFEGEEYLISENLATDPWVSVVKSLTINHRFAKWALKVLDIDEEIEKLELNEEDCKMICRWEVEEELMEKIIIVRPQNDVAESAMESEQEKIKRKEADRLWKKASEIMGATTADAEVENGWIVVERTNLIGH